MRGPSKSPTSRRLIVYLTGIAIGFVLLGMFSARRSQEAAARTAAAAAGQTPGPSQPADSRDPTPLPPS